MERIAFLLNGTPVDLPATDPTCSLLDWLRESRGLCGTKEGCNEGDCGACSVMVSDEQGMRTLNACLLFLPQLHGKALRTVEGLADHEGGLHPVQTAMITHHASQCGFCTPGIAVALAVAHHSGSTAHDDTLSGNLCRCTGYAPIIRAAQAAEAAPKAAWIDDRAALPLLQISSGGEAEGRGGQTAPLPLPPPLPPPPAPAPFAARPKSLAELDALYHARPDALLVGGATDIGLWVTKGLRKLPALIFLNGLAELARVHDEGAQWRLGAGVNIATLARTLALDHPHLADFLRRFASSQIRNAATLGGNIANGSPIGDLPPALIALGARLHLRSQTRQRDMALEDFFLDYGKQDRGPGEFIAAVTLVKKAPHFRAYKISKRFDQDISTLSAAINLRLEDNRIFDLRIAFGGMAGTPKRARATEAALEGKPFTLANITAAAPLLRQDFTPLSDARAGARYRMQVAMNLLSRYFHDLSGTSVSVREVQP